MRLCVSQLYPLAQGTRCKVQGKSFKSQAKLAPTKCCYAVLVYCCLRASFGKASLRVSRYCITRQRKSSSRLWKWRKKPAKESHLNGCTRCKVRGDLAFLKVSVKKPSDMDKVAVALDVAQAE